MAQGQLGGHTALIAKLGLISALLMGCQIALPQGPEPVAPEPAAVPVTPSVESQAFASYYANVEARLVANGLLRTDGGGPDTPVTQRDLAGNFERIALYDEYSLTGGRFVQRETPSILRRWTGPVRLQAHFGDSVPPALQARDRAGLVAYGRRLGRITGHPISTVNADGNFHVLFLNRDEQLAAGPLLRQLVPGINEATINEITGLPRFTFCSVYAFSRADAEAEYITAVAIIRTEHPDLLRQSCVHEEVAQGLGLPNDSPSARPSIFNDDEEFALLTRHDELLLRILYDARLTPGMEAEEARPIIEEISAELVGGAS